MKKILLLALAFFMGAISSFAYDQATEWDVYYGSKCQAYGLSDGTVAISVYYLADGETDVVFPATIQIWEGEIMTAEYEVSSVGCQGWDFWFDKSGASGMADITSITVSEGVKIINGNFYGATSLTKLVLPSTLTNISKEWAFSSASALTRIECYATTPPTIANGVFDWNIFSGETCSALVPDGAAAAYNTADWTYWQELYGRHLVYEATYPSIGTIGYSTYYNDYGYVMPEGVEGYLIDWTDGGHANIVKVYDAGDEVYAGLALLWKSTEELTEKKWYTVEALASGGATATWPVDGESNPYSTVLYGYQTAQTISAPWENPAGFFYYKLANDESNGLGWYWGADEGAAFVSGAHKAFMAIGKAAGARSFIGFDEDGETAIESVAEKAESNDAVYYNIQGQRVENPTKGGLYIMNGKKVLY